MNPHLEATKLGIVIDGDSPIEIKILIVDYLRSPLRLLQAITSYAKRLKPRFPKK